MIAKTLSEAYRMAERTIGEPTPYEVSDDAYMEGLEVLPPIYGKRRFWVGELWDHADGPRSLELWVTGEGKDARCWCRISKVEPNAKLPEMDYPARDTITLGKGGATC